MIWKPQICTLYIINVLHSGQMSSLLYILSRKTTVGLKTKHNIELKASKWGGCINKVPKSGKGNTKSQLYSFSQSWLIPLEPVALGWLYENQIVHSLSPWGQNSSHVKWRARETVTDWGLWAQVIRAHDSTARQVVTEARKFNSGSGPERPNLRILPICLRESFQIWAQPAQITA